MLLLLQVRSCTLGTWLPEQVLFMADRVCFTLLLLLPPPHASALIAAAAACPAAAGALMHTGYQSKLQTVFALNCCCRCLLPQPIAFHVTAAVSAAVGALLHT
jgi:hypothetical protein